MNGIQLKSSGSSFLIDLDDPLLPRMYKLLLIMTNMQGEKRRKRCNECSECKKEDCGSCQTCKDMLKFGGSGCRKHNAVNIENAVR